MAAAEAKTIRLIAGLYEAALHPHQWSHALASLSAELNASLSVLFTQHLETGMLEFAAVGGNDGTKPDAARGLGGLSSSPEETEQSPCRLDLVISRDRLTVSTLSVRRHRERGPFTRDERRTLMQVAPHVRRALSIQAELLALNATAEAVARALDYLPVGIVVVDEKGRVLQTNRSAEAILQRKDGLATSPEGTLQTARPAETALLREVIQRAAGGSGRRVAAVDGKFAVSRPSLRRPFAVTVSRLPSTAHVKSFRCPSAAVFISDPEDAEVGTEQTLLDLYRLTPAEARVGLLLMRGRNLREAADDLRVSRETVRNHLKRIYQKTSTHRQSELMRLLLSGPAGLKFEGRGEGPGKD
jgi:DNA-binding CsgD family transcriptional regulator